MFENVAQMIEDAGFEFKSDPRSIVIYNELRDMFVNDDYDVNNSTKITYNGNPLDTRNVYDIARRFFNLGESFGRHRDIDGIDYVEHGRLRGLSTFR